MDHKKTDTPTASKNALSAEDAEELMAQAWAHWKSETYDKATTLLTRLMSDADAEVLASLSDQMKRQHEMTLAEWSAKVRFREARSSSRNGAIRLRRVSRYELEAVVNLLVMEYSHAFDEPVSLQKAAPSSQPADQNSDEGSRVFRIAEWLDRVPEPVVTRQRLGRDAPSESEGHIRYLLQSMHQKTSTPYKRTKQEVNFDGSSEEAHRFAQQIRYAISLNREWARYDRDVRSYAGQSDALYRERAHLVQLLKMVEARADGALTSTEEQRLWFQQDRKRRVWRRNLELEATRRKTLINKVLIDAGVEPSARLRTMEIEGEVQTEQSPSGVKRKLKARVVPAIPPEILEDGAPKPSSEAEGAPGS